MLQGLWILIYTKCCEIDYQFGCYILHCYQQCKEIPCLLKSLLICGDSQHLNACPLAVGTWHFPAVSLPSQHRSQILVDTHKCISNTMNNWTTHMWLKGKTLPSEINTSVVFKYDFSKLKGFQYTRKLHLSEPAFWSSLADELSLVEVNCRSDPIFYMLLTLTA